MTLGTNGRRVAVIEGGRTPFCRSGTVFNDVSAVDLARHAALEVIQRAELDPGSVDLVVMGQRMSVCRPAGQAGVWGRQSSS